MPLTLTIFAGAAERPRPLARLRKGPNTPGRWRAGALDTETNSRPTLGAGKRV